jgi:predicted ester cyclase
VASDFRELAGKIVNAFNNDKLDMLDEVYSPDAVIHLAGVADFDPPAYKTFLAGVLKAFPDAAMEEVESITAADSGWTRIVLRGTLTGEQAFYPCESRGQKVKQDYLIAGHTKEGRVTEVWISSDRLSLMQQLGVIPATA